MNGGGLGRLRLCWWRLRWGFGSAMGRRIRPQGQGDQGRGDALVGNQQLHRRALLGPQAHHPQGALGLQQVAVGTEHAHLHQRGTIHPQHQA
ncbi:MAG: hypothetical protein ACK56F_15795, partial [bacterium]